MIIKKNFVIIIFPVILPTKISFVILYFNLVLLFSLFFRFEQEKNKKKKKERLYFF
jgi:hypothetical protein